MLNIDERELAVELLNAIKKFFKFKELESILGMPIPTLWRYIHGAIKPSPERAKEIIDQLLRDDILKTVLDRVIEVDSGEYVNLYNLVYNVDILTIASIDAYLWVRRHNLQPSTVVTVEVDGIPLATMIAKRLNTKLVVIKRRKEIGYREFYEVSYVARDPPEIITLYLPQGVLHNDDRVLVVDDLVRTGRTTKAVLDLVNQTKARVVGFYALLGVGDRWKSVVAPHVESYRVLFHL